DRRSFPTRRSSDLVEAVGEVKNREHTADVALFQPADERKMKVLTNLCIQGKEGGKALAVGRPNVILERVKVGVGEPGMNIENGAEGDSPRYVDASPGNQPVRN